MKNIRPRITEPSRQVPVADRFDVVCVGAGIAGSAAAVAAARTGARVGLVEKTCSPGGLATLANVVYYLPLCDGCGRQVIGGLGEELLKLSIRDGTDEIPECWRAGGEPKERTKKRYRVRFNPACLLLELEQLLVSEGVKIFYDTRFCSVHRDAGRIDSIVVENKDGRSALRAGAVVDATGDADACTAAGEPTVSLDTNGAAAWFFYDQAGEFKLCSCHAAFDAAGGPPPDGDRGFAGDDARDVTEHVLASRRMIRQRLQKMAENSQQSVRPLLVPTMPSFRMTRRLKGEVELEREDEGNAFPDVVGLTGDWRAAGPVYHIPLRALVAPQTDNLITAGRCISSAGAWDVTRAIPACVVTGQAAGVASALSARRGGGISEMEISLIQDTLREQDVMLESD